MSLDASYSFVVAEFFHNNHWILSPPAQIASTEQFWVEVYEEKDSVGGRTCKELATCALQMLLLPTQMQKLNKCLVQ